MNYIKFKQGEMMKLAKFFIIAISIGLFLNACSSDVSQTKLAFLNDLSESKVTFSEEEKIERIKTFYKEKLNHISDLEIDFVEKINANDNLEFDAYVFDFKLNGESQKEILFMKGNFFFSDFANVETLDTSKEKAIKILESQQNEAIVETLKEDKEFIVTLGNGKKEVFVFSDPLCPFCKQHLEKIDKNYLEEYTLHFIFVSVHGDNGFNRANLIYENINKATNDMQKLEIIKSYYDENINQEPLFDNQSLALKTLFEKYRALGIKYVPYIIER